MSIAPSLWVLILGRLIIGFGAGLGLCVTPVYLNELSPPKIRGRVGVLNQLAVVLGILLTQGVGLLLAASGLWRYVLAISSCISAIQFVTSALVVDTPVWLESAGKKEESEQAKQVLWVSIPPTSGQCAILSPTS